MRTRNDIERLIEDINNLRPGHTDVKGHFVLKERRWENEQYPDEMELSLMFVKKGVEICPYSVISRTIVLTHSINNPNMPYQYFYDDLLNYLVFCRADTTQTFIDIRGDAIKCQAISQWLTEG